MILNKEINFNTLKEYRGQYGYALERGIEIMYSTAYAAVQIRPINKRGKRSTDSALIEIDPEALDEVIDHLTYIRSQLKTQTTQ